MAFKMLRVSPNIQAGLNGKGQVVINSLFWTDENSDFVDAILTKQDCIALGDFVASGKIDESRNHQPKSSRAKL
jgi:hypothetical protein